MTWTARIIADDGCEQEATGITAADSVLNLVADIMDQWRRGEADVCGDYLTELGQAITQLESHDDDSEFESQCGDFSQPWTLIVERTTCDQLGNGCTCEDCTRQIADACGIIYDCTPVNLDSPEYDDDDCEKVEPTGNPDYESLRYRVEHEAHRMGYLMDINTVPDRLWDLWLCQGQSLQQMANLCREFDKSPATF